MPDINLDDLQQSLVVRPITAEDFDQIIVLQQNSFGQGMNRVLVV